MSELYESWNDTNLILSNCGQLLRSTHLCAINILELLLDWKQKLWVSIMLIFSVMLNRKYVLLNITSSVPQLPRLKLYIPEMKLYGCFTLERSSCTISQKQEAIMRCKGHSWVRNRGRKRINLDCGLKSWRPYNAVWSLGWPPCLADRKEWKPTLRRIIFSLTTDPDK